MTEAPIDWYGEHGPRGNVREAVALFDHHDELDDAVEDLEQEGISLTAVSRMARRGKVEQTLHRDHVDAADLEDDPHAPRAVYVDRSFKSAAHGLIVFAPAYFMALVGAGGAAASGMSNLGVILWTAGLGGAGVCIGLYLLFFVKEGEHLRDEHEEEMGGLMLWVKTNGSDQENAVLEILKQRGGHDVHMHGPAPAE